MENKGIIETIISAKTHEQAVALGAAELGVDISIVKSEVLEEARRGILGIGASDAKVRVYYEITPVMAAKNFLSDLVKNMELEASIEVVEEGDDAATLAINGDGLGLLIGRHGDVLDSLQYLTNLAANKGSRDFYRITVDIENYRAKRAETLKALARRMADKALKYKRSFVLEPMSSYERRIIHSECQQIPEINTYSIGEDQERRVVITSQKAAKRKEAQKK